MTEIVATHKLNLQDVEIVQALVYSSESNCAELKRTFQLELHQGYNEVKIQNLPLGLVKDSIRVSGSGEAVIHDVSVKNQEGADFVIPERVLAIKAILQEKGEAMNRISDRKTALEKRIEGLDNLLTESVKNGKDGSLHFDGRTIDSLNALHAYHQDKTVDLRAQVRALNEEHKQALEEYNRASKDWHNTGYSCRNSAQYASIVVESTDGGVVELTITYQVNNVAWFPFYDIRVTSGEDSEMHITYFGKVRQFSGEDWKNAPLILSTAKPARDQRVPELDALEAYIADSDSDNWRGRSRGGRGGRRFRSRSRSRSISRDRCVPKKKRMTMAFATVESINIASEFSIGRPATIDDRTEEYKVNIGQFTLPTKLSNVTVPSRNAAAFVVANSVNSSDYPLVAGQASIFLDGAFVKKMPFNEIMVSQKFYFGVGLDPNIRVEYKPVKKYQEKSGLFEKLNTQVTEKTTVVTNLRHSPVLLTIREQLPRSTDSRIQVTLLTPEAKEVDEPSTEPTVGAELTPEKILDYTVQLAPGESQTFVVKYATVHPAEEKVMYVESS